MLVNSDYDWRGYFEQCRNKHLKHYKRPLAYQYEAGDVASKYLPGVRYKVWGHAEQKWRGENDSIEGKDLRPYVQPPNPAHRPEKLPPVPWVTEEISKNVRKVAQKEARISAEYLLSEEERLRMPRVNFRNDGTAPPHPAWRGCRLLDASEVQSLFWQLPFACSPVPNRSTCTGKGHGRSTKSLAGRASSDSHWEKGNVNRCRLCPFPELRVQNRLWVTEEREVAAADLYFQTLLSC
eukprot:g13433.t1